MSNVYYYQENGFRKNETARTVVWLSVLAMLAGLVYGQVHGAPEVGAPRVDLVGQ